MPRASRVLVLRPDNIGDVLLFSGALRHLREKYRDAVITVAVQRHIVPLLELCPFIDEVVALDPYREAADVKPKGRVAKFRRFLRRLARMANPPFDVVIYPVRSPHESHLRIVRDLTAPAVIGVAGCNINAPPGGFRKNLTSLYTDSFDAASVDPWLTEIEFNLRFLENMNIPVRDVTEIRPTVWPSEDDVATAARLLPSAGQIIGIFPGASFDLKCWDVANYPAVASAVQGEGVFALFGSPTDLEICREVESALRKGRPDWQVINLCGATSLRELYCCISRCSVLITTDSAGLHFAIAAEIPTVVVAGRWHQGRFTDCGERRLTRVVTRELDCQGCNMVCVRSRFECLQGVQPEEVALSVNDLLTL